MGEDSEPKDGRRERITSADGDEIPDCKKLGVEVRDLLG